VSLTYPNGRVINYSYNAGLATHDCRGPIVRQPRVGTRADYAG
jgi:hypothetical protein